MARCSPTYPSGSTTVVGVIGDPIRHSWSPLLHQAAFDALGLDWVSLAFCVPEGKAAEALVGMRALGIAGLSVTMPHKAAAAEAVDEITPLAARLGAVNCVTNRAGVLVGDSTDGAGLLLALQWGAGWEPAGRRCAVVGAGGAGRAAVAALADAGADEVLVVNRTRARGEAAAALAGRCGRVGAASELAEAELIVQATPGGMHDRPGADGDTLPLDPGVLHGGQVVVDFVYHPRTTPLLAAAAARGAVAVDGVGILIGQAAVALQHWTGEPAPVAAMWAAVGTMTA